MLIFRPHPDQSDPNAWGSSLYLTPFLSTGQPGSGVVDSVTPTSSGIDVAAHGSVNADSAGGTTYGTFSLAATFSYNMATQQLAGLGTMQVNLAGALAAAGGFGADSNLARIASNCLSSVPLVGGGVGNTGDMAKISVSYGRTGGDPHNFDWLPASLPATYPSYASSVLSTNVIGAVNNVNGVALGLSPLAVATKPTLSVAMSTSNGANLLSFGGQYDTTQAKNPYADNVGVECQVLRGLTASTSFQLGLQIQSNAPPTWNGASSAGNNWSTSANWQGNAAAQNCDVLRFGQVDGPGNQLTSNNDLPAGALLNGIIFSSSASSYTLSGNPASLGGAVVNQSGNDQTIALPLTLAAGGGMFDTWPADIAVTGPIGGSGPLVKSGSGTLTLSGTNSYSGGTTVSGGTLDIAAPSGARRQRIDDDCRRRAAGFGGRVGHRVPAGGLAAGRFGRDCPQRGGVASGDDRADGEQRGERGDARRRCGAAARRGRKRRRRPRRGRAGTGNARHASGRPVARRFAAAGIIRDRLARRRLRDLEWGVAAASFIGPSYAPHLASAVRSTGVLSRQSP